MTTTIVLNDHVAGFNHSFILREETKDLVASRWDAEDPLLVTLHNRAMFGTGSRWSELSMTEFRLLLTLHLGLFGSLIDSQRYDETLPLNRSLEVLLGGFVNFLELRLQGSIGLVTIRRVKDSVITYDLSASLHGFDMPRARTPSLKIIVDNG